VSHHWQTVSWQLIFLSKMNRVSMTTSSTQACAVHCRLWCRRSSEEKTPNQWRLELARQHRKKPRWNVTSDKLKTNIGKKKTRMYWRNYSARYCIHHLAWRPLSISSLSISQSCLFADMQKLHMWHGWLSEKPVKLTYCLVSQFTIEYEC